jgi:CheY-like chemotaxis protein
MGQRKTVLLADDNPDDVEFLARELADRGYKVHACTNGEEALEAAQRIRPDVVILDVLMPRVDGTQVSLALQAEESTRRIPVIFLTWLKRHDDNEGSSLEEPSVVFSKPIERPEAVQIADFIDRLPAEVFPKPS